MPPINIDPDNCQFLVETNLPTPYLVGSMLIYWRVNKGKLTLFRKTENQSSMIYQLPSGKLT